MTTRAHEPQAHQDEHAETGTVLDFPHQRPTTDGEPVNTATAERLDDPAAVGPVLEGELVDEAPTPDLDREDGGPVLVDAPERRERSLSEALRAARAAASGSSSTRISDMWARSVMSTAVAKVPRRG